jgi:hypothetical protein
MKKILILLITVLLSAQVFSQDVSWNTNREKVPDQPVKEFQFLAYFFNRNVVENYYAKNDLLKGQVVGRLFSFNTTTTGEQAMYSEQRLIPFFIYQPKLLDGRALLRASFEIDWTWGDANYGTGGNFGSAFAADQVNIQTQNVELEFLPGKAWTINLGLQRLFDTPYNPYRTFLTTMLSTSYGLMMWGSDAVGISIRKDFNYSRFQGGFYQLYENNIQQPDDVTLWDIMYEQDITPEWRQGFSLHYVYDRGNGEGGVSVLGEGLNSLLDNYNGTYKFTELEGKPYKADLFWLGTYGNYNPEYLTGRFSLNAFTWANLGEVRKDVKGEYKHASQINGIASNLRTGYRYGQTPEDKVEMNVIFTTGDKDAANLQNTSARDDKYTGVLTGNMWTAPGALNINTGAYILYPNGNVVNRYIAAVSDISNMGLGQIGGTINIYHSFIPHKLFAKIGGAAANSIFNPNDGKKFIGWELNARISYQPAVYMNIELHAAYMWLGGFYNSPDVNGNVTIKPKNPYTIFTVFKWLMF